MTEPRRKDVLERGLGALLGQAVGDALGTTVEFQSASSIRSRHPQGLREVVGGGPFNVAPGQVTDDTELALCLARSLADRGTYDADDVARRYLAWYRSGPFDVGRATRQAFGAPVAGTASIAAALERRANAQTEANGSLMRASPLGVFGWQLEPAQLAELAARDSRLSHPSPVCQAACVAFTHAIAFAVREGGPATAVYEATLAFVRATPAAAAVQDTLELAGREAPRDYEQSMGWVRIALQNAFFQLLHAPNLEEGLVATVMGGGDTDTNGCIAGALLGSTYGASAIPARWRDTVLSCSTRRPSEYGCTDLPQLAEQLCFGRRSPRTQS